VKFSMSAQGSPLPAAGVPVRRLSTTLGFTLRNLVLSARPWEWTKNAFVFAALLFSNNLFNPDLAVRSVLAFLLYCLAASGVYLVNDIWDREEDKKHPQKRARPVASGALPVGVAAAAAATLLSVAVAGAFWLRPSFGAVAAAYVLLTSTYSRWLKHVVILDVFAIAAGFVLRVVAGAVVIDVIMSHWLLICAMLLALFLGFSKRRSELVALADGASLHRRVLAEYSPLFLDMMIGIVTSATVVAYALYPRNHGGNPARTLLADGPLLVNMIIWGLVSIVILYSARW
jgi:4-hydroxybenzoate polyprenyltransferase